MDKTNDKWAQHLLTEFGIALPTVLADIALIKEAIKILYQRTNKEFIICILLSLVEMIEDNELDFQQSHKKVN